MYKDKMPQCNYTSTEWQCKCNRKINDDNKKKVQQVIANALSYLQYPYECVTMHVRNVWMFQCDCCRLLLSTGTCVIWFSCKLPDTLVQTPAVPGAVWARPSSQNAAASNLAIHPSVRPSACLCKHEARQDIVHDCTVQSQCSHSAVWRELCPVIDTPPHSANQSRRVRYSGSCVHSVQSDFRRKIKREVEQKEFMSARFNTKTIWNMIFLLQKIL